MPIVDVVDLVEETGGDDVDKNMNVVDEEISVEVMEEKIEDDAVLELNDVVTTVRVEVTVELLLEVVGAIVNAEELLVADTAPSSAEKVELVLEVVSADKIELVLNVGETTVRAVEVVIIDAVFSPLSLDISSSSPDSSSEKSESSSDSSPESEESSSESESERSSRTF